VGNVIPEHANGAGAPETGSLYLTERHSDIRISATLIDMLEPLCKEYFPVRANVSPYSEFVSQHRHFLLFTDLDWPEEWVAKKAAQLLAALLTVLF
jgi:hypothetical protein